MARYGSIHQLSDFVERTIPKKGSGEYETLFVHRVINFLKRLDAARQGNPWIVLATHTGGGIWLYYKGRAVFLIIPALKRFRLALFKEFPTPDKRDLVHRIRHEQKRRRLFQPVGSFPFAWQWHCGGPELSILEGYIKHLPSDTASAAINSATHPRNFPGEVLDAALQQFIEGGRYCKGFRRKRHKITNERIEFDHLLPFAKGGSSSAFNVQVLCETCNRMKRARAG